MNRRVILEGKLEYILNAAFELGTSDIHFTVGCAAYNGLTAI